MMFCLLLLNIFALCTCVQTSSDNVNKVEKDFDLQKVEKELEKELLGRELRLTLDKLNLPLNLGKISKKSTTQTEGDKTTLDLNTLNLKRESLAKHAVDEENAVEKYNHVDSCFDVFGTKKCQILINDPNLRIACDKDRMQEMCKLSCGYCGHTHSVEKCSNSKFGCCESNKLLTKVDKVGSNCPECKDKVAKLCESYESDCNEVGMVGEWMRANCLKTCHVCKEKVKPKIDCEDDKEHGGYCPAWKQEGLCRQIPELMRAHCKKTCDYC